MAYNRKTFFDQFRPFLTANGRKLTQDVVSAVEFLLTEFEKGGGGITRREQIAYCLATIAHETAWTFKPIKEYRAKAGSAGRANQDRYWLSGYYGRGFVQLTWEKNYKKLGEAIGRPDLVTMPDLALDPFIAFDILTAGMSKGLFTGKKLSDFINSNQKDYINARKIINGLDKARHIATIAAEFDRILKASAESAHPATNEQGNSPQDPQTTAPAPPINVENVENVIAAPSNPANVVVERDTPTEPKPGFVKRIWLRIVGAWLSIGGADAVSAHAQQVQALGLPPEFWTRFFYAATALIGGWLVYVIWIEAISPAIANWRKRRLTTKLIDTNSTPGNLVTLAKAEDLAKYEAEGWVAIRRGS